MNTSQIQCDGCDRTAAAFDAMGWLVLDEKGWDEYAIRNRRDACSVACATVVAQKIVDHMKRREAAQEERRAQEYARQREGC